MVQGRQLGLVRLEEPVQIRLRVPVDAADDAGGEAGDEEDEDGQAEDPPRCRHEPGRKRLKIN